MRDCLKIFLHQFFCENKYAVVAVPASKKNKSAQPLTLQFATLACKLQG